MKLLAVLPIIAAVSAWQVRFVGKEGKHIDTMGPRIRAATC